MGKHSQIAIPVEADAESNRFGVLVGWSHSPCGSGISLKVQSAESQAALGRGEIDSMHLLMTRNQSMLLARYLLEATGQWDDLPERPHGWRAAWARFRRRR